jgi:hypothetical protein
MLSEVSPKKLTGKLKAESGRQQFSSVAYRPKHVSRTEHLKKRVGDFGKIEKRSAQVTAVGDRRNTPYE